MRFNMDGVTRRYGVEGSTPRRSAFGPEMRAQSRGEWPGVRSTLRLGLLGLAECVGGGARPPNDDEGGPRFGTGPRARCGEFIAGNCESVGIRPTGGFAVDVGGGSRPGGGGGGIMEGWRAVGRPRDGAGPGAVGLRRGAGWELGAIGALSRLKLGTLIDGGFDATAFGVVCSSSGSAIVGGGGATFGRGGGSIDETSPLAALREDEVLVAGVVGFPWLTS